MMPDGSLLTGCRLGCADVHKAIDLPTVRADDFAANKLSQIDGKTCFSHRCRTEADANSFTSQVRSPRVYSSPCHLIQCKPLAHRCAILDRIPRFEKHKRKRQQSCDVALQG